MSLFPFRPEVVREAAQQLLKEIEDKQERGYQKAILAAQEPYRGGFLFLKTIRRTPEEAKEYVDWKIARIGKAGSIVAEIELRRELEWKFLDEDLLRWARQMVKLASAVQEDALLVVEMSCGGQKF